ncbi:hypothetical protein ABPG75_003226 [Micractinium tetrahymenae]
MNLLKPTALVLAVLGLAVLACNPTRARLLSAEPAAGPGGGAAATGGAIDGGEVPTDGSGGGAAAATPPPLPPADQLAEARSIVASLLNSTLAFWAEHGPDWEQGGFFTTLDRWGQPILGYSTSDKYLLTSARQIVAWATLALQHPEDERGWELAQRAFAFFNASALYDPADGLFRYQVSRDGATPYVDNKFLYGQAFAIMGLARYGRLVGDEDAVLWAYQVFQAVDRQRHDPMHGGYLETVEQAFPLESMGIHRSPGTSRMVNTHTHLTEALTELSRALQELPAFASPENAVAAPAMRAAVDARLAEMVRLLGLPGAPGAGLWVPFPGELEGGHLGAEFREDWGPLDPGSKVYKEEFISVYFLQAAARQLGWAGADLQAVRDLAIKLGRAGQEGFDPFDGGIWTDGCAGGPCLKDTCSGGAPFKFWAAQVEGASGQLWMWVLTGEPLYWDRWMAVLHLVANHLNDPEGQEFFYNVDTKSGAPVCGGTIKADRWKANYHVFRALLYWEEWLAALAAGQAPVPKV